MLISQPNTQCVHTTELSFEMFWDIFDMAQSSPKGPEHFLVTWPSPCSPQPSPAAEDESFMRCLHDDLFKKCQEVVI